MSIDFTLTPDQQKLQKIARAFSEDVLKPVVKEADLEPDTQKAFQMMKGPYKEAYKRHCHSNTLAWDRRAV